MFPDAPPPRAAKRRPEHAAYADGEDLSFFGLVEPPFDTSPDPRFFFESHTQDEACRKVLDALNGAHSLVTVIGDEGSGKSTFCGEIARRLPAPAKAVFVDAVSKDDLLDQLLQQVTEGHKAPVPSGRDSEETRRQMFLSLQRHLASHIDTAHVIVVADDAERLESEALEWLVVLSNLAVGPTKLLRVVLVGAPGLDVKLRNERLVELAPNGAFRCRLPALRPSELAPYLEQRLHVARGDRNAAGDRTSMFAAAAVRAIYSATAGVPGKINRVAARAIALAAGRRLDRIEASLVREAAGRPRSAGTTNRIAGLSTAAGIVVVAGATYMAILWIWQDPAIGPESSVTGAAGPTVQPPAADAPVEAPAPAPDATASPAPVVEAPAPTPADATPVQAPPTPATTTPPRVPETPGRASQPAAGAVDAPSPAAAPARATTTAAGTATVILAGSFRNAKNADDITAALVANGLRAWVRRDADRGWHFVYIGPYATRDDARAELPRVQAEFGLKDAVVRTAQPPTSPPPLQESTPAASAP